MVQGVAEAQWRMVQPSSLRSCCASEPSPPLWSIFGHHVLHSVIKWKHNVRVSQRTPQFSFAKLEAEAVSEVPEKYEISSDATFLFFKNSQLCVSGNLIGGLDIVKQLEASEKLDTICLKAPRWETRLRVVTNKASVMLFMKGNKQKAKCGFVKLWKY